MEEPIDPVIRSEPVATPVVAPVRSSAAPASGLPGRIRAFEAGLAVAALLALAAFAVSLASGPFDYAFGPLRVGVRYPSAPFGLFLGFVAAAAVTRMRAAGHEWVVRVPSLALTLTVIASVTIPEMHKIGLAVTYVVALLFAIEGIVRGAYPFRRTPLDLPIAIFAATQLAAALLAKEQSRCLGEFFSSTIPPLVLLYSIHEHGRWRPAAVKAVIATVALSVVILLVVGYRRYFTSGEPFFIANLGWYTRTGRFLNLTLPLVAGLAIWRGPALVRLGALVLALAASVALVLTQSRGAWAGAVASFVFLGFFLDRRLLIVLAGALLLAIAAAPQRLVDHARSMFDFANFGESSTVSPLKYRPAAWRFAVESIADKPLIGHGLGASGFREGFVEAVSPPPNHGIANAHNVFLEVAYESGLVGLAAFLALVGSMFALGFRSRGAPRDREPGRFPLATVSLAALVGVLVHGLVSHVTHDPLSGLFFAQGALVLLDRPTAEAPAA